MRIVDCDHWSEEVGYGDEARAKQIKTSVEKLKCGSLEKDRSDFLNRHPDNKKIKNAFTIADSWSGICN